MFCFTRLDGGEIWLNADHVVMVLEDYDRKGITRISLTGGGIIHVQEKVDMVIMSLSAVENAKEA